MNFLEKLQALLGEATTDDDAKERAQRERAEAQVAQTFRPGEGSDIVREQLVEAHIQRENGNPLRVTQRLTTNMSGIPVSSAKFQIKR